jgi:hypothetical protein
MKRAVYLALLFIFALQPLVQAEIIKAIVFWQAANCDDRCAQMLERQFQAISSVQTVKMYPSGGAAELYWKPLSGFDWNILNLAFKRVGPQLREVQVYVRGTIQSGGSNRFFLTSLGDNARFELLSPSLRSDTAYVESNNIIAHQITDPLRSQLQEAAQNQTLVTIQGPMFEPWRYNMLLIVNNMTAEQN